MTLYDLATLCGSYLMVGVAVYWWRNKMAPWVVLKEAAMWPYFVYKMIF